MNSSSKRGFSPSVGMGVDSRKSFPPHTNNGSGPPPLKYSSEPMDDVNMNEVIDENIELEVILPGGKTTQLTVDSNIPMQDLRVLLAAKNKVSPTGYILNVISDETGKPLDYKANQTIGSLEGRIVELVSKTKDKDVGKAKTFKTQTSRNSQPFETTHRFTINLPRNQKMVMRISPEMNLTQLFAHVCKEKHLDTRRYTLQHTTNPQFSIDMRSKVADLKSNEINLIPLGLVADSARSMPDLSRSESLSLPRESAYPTYMPGAAEPKKKKGFLSFLKRKDNKFKVQEMRQQDMETSSTVSHQMTVAQNRHSMAPPRERTSSDAAEVQVRPKSMFVTAREAQAHQEASSNLSGKENTLPRPPARKKRPAPPPPQQTPTIPETVEISVEEKNATNKIVQEKKLRVRENAEVVTKGTPDHVTQRLHSRNSSDSSGYHELTLSGAESPEASRGSTTFKTSIDTTSIESADNTNGDSGISGNSPVHTAQRHKEMMAGDSQTLPLPKHSKQPDARSHSLERKDKGQKTLPPPSTKKRRAPAPPPPPAAAVPPEPPSTSSTPSHSPATSQVIAKNAPVKEESPTPEQYAVTAPLEIKETETSQSIKYDDDDDDDDDVDINETLDGLMMMVEDVSIASEDIDNIDQPKSVRPCSFVPPPPPDEPPPPKSPEAETVDVGVEVHDNASLGPSSVKNSPVATHSRTESQSSISSVNTIEDINMAFEQTIAMAEEFMEAERPAETGYKNEMARFVEKMSQLTEKADLDANTSDASISLADTESNSETGSIVQHEMRTDNYSYDSGFAVKFDSEERSREGSTDASDGLSSAFDDSPVPSTVTKRRRDSLEIHRANSMADKDVSEIDVPVETVPPPIEFRNDSDCEEEEEEEEMFVETTEEIIITLPPGSMAFGGGYNIPDFQTPKEHSGLPDSPRSRSFDQALSYSEFRAEKTPPAPSETLPKAVEKPKPPRPKEEYVLTSEELNKIKYVDENKYRERQAYYAAKRPTSLDTGYRIQPTYPTETVVSYASFRPSVSDEVDSGYFQDDSVMSRCTELSFRPDTEEEIDNVLEEKSISMLALPAMRTSVLKKTDDEYLDSLKQDQYKSSAEMNTKLERPYTREEELVDERDHIVQATPVYIAESPTEDIAQEADASNDDELKRQQASLQAQYDLLQQQFTMWQVQLEQNQKLLASQHLEPEVQTIQQLQAQQMQMQMQMQQQMMSQLQKSMDALSVQQKQKNEPVPVPVPTKQPQAKESVLVVPVSPPPPKSEVAPAVKAGKPKRKNDPRFERKLDPREELMIAIRGFGGHNVLKKVPEKQTQWNFGSSVES